MRIEIKVDPDIGEPVAVIHTPKVTPELMAWVETFEQTKKMPPLLFTKKDNKIFVIDPEQVDIVRTEGKDIKLYTRDAQGYLVTMPLHEIQERLSGSSFIRIAKSSIINLNRVDHLSPSFNGTMSIVMKNGISDYISRKYLAEFKKRLGL